MAMIPKETRASRIWPMKAGNVAAQDGQVNGLRHGLCTARRTMRAALSGSLVSADEGFVMRRGLSCTWVLLAVAAGCGRIGYTPLSGSDAGGAGLGGAAAGNGGRGGAGIG